MNTPKNIGWSVVLFVVVMGLWEGLTRAFHMPGYILPPPSQIAMAIYRGVAGGIYVKHMMVTIGGTVLGFVAGCAMAFSLGTAVALSRRADYFLYPYIVMFQAMPKVALAPLIIVWFGLGVTSKVVSAALVAFFPLMVNTIVGLRSADEDRVNLMRSLAATESQIFWKLRVPSALPFIMAGLEVAMILALIGTIVAEFVGAEAGLGMLIQTMNFNMDVAGQFSVLLILSAVGLLLNKIVAYARRRVLFWDFSEKSMAGQGEDKPAGRLLSTKGEAA
ncbi:MAG TPA: ABC transporter permease [bacterium]